MNKNDVRYNSYNIERYLSHRGGILCTDAQGLLLVILIAMTANAKTVINLSGTVKDKAGKPIAKAIVTLSKQGLSDTTDSDGTYKISSTSISILPLLQPRNRTIFMDHGFLEFSLPVPSPVKVEIFDVNGKLLQKEIMQVATTGFYRFNIEQSIRAAKVIVVRASIGQDMVTFRYFSLGNGKFMVKQAHESSNRVEEKKLAKVMAVDDTLKTTASGYITDTKAITSYEQVVDITMDTVGGYIVGRSAGCGKSTTLKGEKRFTISSGGKDREYILRLPDDYDPNTTYKLWFAIHPLSGTAEMVANQKGYEYYGIWKFANPSGGK